LKTFKDNKAQGAYEWHKENERDQFMVAKPLLSLIRSVPDSTITISAFFFVKKRGGAGAHILLIFE
jgi:hypothetical protein